MLASIAVLAVIAVGLPVVRSTAADAARSVGQAVTGVPGALQTEAMGADGPYRPAGDPTLDGSQAPGTGATGSDPVQVSATSTGQVVVSGLDRPFDPSVTSAFTPWFPPVDEDGVPTPSTSGTPVGDDPVEIPEVPVEFTPTPTPFPTEDPTPFPTDETTPFPTEDPTPFPTVEPTPTPTPSFDPGTPAPEPTPSPGPTSAAPSTSVPAPTPTPTSPRPVVESALRFSPPTLTNPIVMAFPEGAVSLKLDVTRDYLLTLPKNRPLVNAKGITISGGRNIVIIGGTVDVRDGSNGARRAMYLKDTTPNGTTFIEGVRFRSSTGALTEGVDLASPGARVVLQNLAFDGALSGSYAANHADVIQSWAGPRVLEIDGLTATTTYQGLFLLPNQHSSAPVDDWSFHRMSVTGIDAAYLLWRDRGAYAIRTSNVYLTGSHLSNGGLWPSIAAWPGASLVRAPEAYAASAGFTYSSPGYR